MRGHQATGQGVSLHDTRIHDRYETHQLVEVLGADGEVVGRLENLSRSGARIYSLSEHDLDVGSSMTVRLLDGTLLDGSVIWRTANGFGFHFHLFLQNPTDHLHFDHMGADYCRRLLSLQTKVLQTIANASPETPVEPIIMTPQQMTPSRSRAVPLRPQVQAPRRYFPGVQRIATLNG